MAAFIDKGLTSTSNFSMSYVAAVNPRHLFIRWLTPVIWRVFPQRKLSALQEFSLIERDSGGQLLSCIPLIADPKLKAHVFQHVLEEVFHGEIFEDLCHSLSSKPLVTPVKAREDLLSHRQAGDEVIELFSYVHIGEQAVNRDFLQYARARLDKKSRAVFARAGGDEGKHECDTGDILLDLVSGDRSAYRKYLWRARAKRAWLLYTAAMSAIGEVVLSALLAATYVFAAAPATLAARRRLKMPASDQLNLLREQVQTFESRHK